MSAPVSASEWVWLARIRRPQGRKGEVFADILTDFPEKFAERRHLWLLAEPGVPPATAGAPSMPPSAKASRHDQGQSAKGGTDQPREVELHHHWLHKGGIVLHFAGVESISDAEALAGLTVAIPRSERASLAEDEVHIADLIGCTVIDVAGDAPAPVGEIENVDRTAGPVPLLIVNGARGEVLIPFAKAYIRNLDLDHRRVEMALPAGLADLNA